MRDLPLILIVATAIFASANDTPAAHEQSGPSNLDFGHGAVGHAPEGWQ